MTDSEPVKYRKAGGRDTLQLAQMRWAAHVEKHGVPAENTEDTFVTKCRSHLYRELVSGTWTCWVASRGDRVISHFFIKEVDELPNPDCLSGRFGFVADAYTRAKDRGQGVEDKLVFKAVEWSREVGLSHLVAWPESENSELFLGNGFERGDAALRCVLQ
jgi:hypothetical protein